MTFIERCVKTSDLCPSLFNLKEVWILNRSRGKYFNTLFAPCYILIIPSLVVITALIMLEVLQKGWSYED